MRISERGARPAVAAVLAVLAACSRPSGPDGTTASDAAIRVPCARGGAPLAPQCLVERRDGAAGTVLTLRAPAGGFRRLLVVRDGRGLVAADGAEPARIAVAGAGLVEVRVGGDRYRLPATVRR